MIKVELGILMKDPGAVFKKLFPNGKIRKSLRNYYPVEMFEKCIHFFCSPKTTELSAEVVSVLKFLEDFTHHAKLSRKVSSKRFDAR